MRRLLPAASLCLWLVLWQTSAAEDLPSFHLPYSAWQATDVVVVDQKGHVLEVWKGTLKAKSELPFGADRFNVSLDVDYDRFFTTEKDRLPNRIVRVTGNRLALFLIRNGDHPVTDKLGWKPASFGNDLATCAVWLEKENSFAVQQWMNPGPSLMRPLHSEESLKKEVIRLAAIQAALRTAAADPDPESRAKKMVLFLEEQNGPGLHEAQRVLENCGKYGWTEVLPLLQDDKRLPLHSGLVHLAAKTAPVEATPIIEAIIIKEIKYWDGLTADEKSVGCSNPPMHFHYSKLSACLFVLKNVGYKDKSGVVMGLRDRWGESPVLTRLGAGGSGRSPILEYADEILKAR
jgi:hypothetical protein